MIKAQATESHLSHTLLQWQFRLSQNFIHFNLLWSWADKSLHFHHASQFPKFRKNTAIFMSLTFLFMFFFPELLKNLNYITCMFIVLWNFFPKGTFYMYLLLPEQIKIYLELFLVSICSFFLESCVHWIDIYTGICIYWMHFYYKHVNCWMF